MLLEHLIVGEGVLEEEEERRKRKKVDEGIFGFSKVIVVIAVQVGLYVMCMSCVTRFHQF